MMAAVAVDPVSAQSITYRANGRLIEYHPDLIAEYPDQILVRGTWRLVIIDEHVEFHANFLEENGPGGIEIPGTIDKFRLSFTQIDLIFFEDTKCFILGDILWQKIGWDVNTGTPLFNSWTWGGLIKVDGSAFTVHHNLIGEEWTIGGSVLSRSEIS
jgi:hypothetical protein